MEWYGLDSQVKRHPCFSLFQDQCGEELMKKVRLPENQGTP